MDRFAPCLTICVLLMLPAATAAQEPNQARPDPETAQDGTAATSVLGLDLGTVFTLGEPPDLSELDFTLRPSDGALLDLYPFGDGFRFTGGLRHYGGDPKSQPSELTIGGLPFTPSADSVLGSGLDLRQSVPYGGVGMQQSFLGGRLEFSLDLGVFRPREGDVDAPLYGPAMGNPRYRVGPALERPPGAEPWNFLGFYPAAGLSATYRF